MVDDTSSGPVRERRFRFLALLVASFGFIMAMLSVVAVLVVQDGRDAREFARGPVIVDDGTGAVALWQGMRDAIERTPHDVVLLEPLTPSAPPPPGLGRWPAPGEVFLSPALADAGAAEHIEDRYGRYAGLIGEAGLLSASERLAYARPVLPPTDDDRTTWRPITGFGSKIPFGDSIYATPTAFLLALCALLGAPALWLIATTVRFGRSRRVAVPPVLLGALLAVVVLAIAMTTRLRLPITGYVLDPADLRAAWPFFGLAVGFAAAVSLGLVGIVRSPRDRERNRRWPAACVAMAVVIAASSYLPGDSGFIVFLAGTTGLWLCLPRAASVVLRRYSTRHLAVFTRSLTAVVIGVALVTGPQIWSNRVGGPAEAAAAVEQHSGDSVLVVDSARLNQQRIDAFTGRLPAGTAVLALRTAEEHGIGDVTLTGSCEAVRVIGGECSPGAAKLPTNTDAAESLRAWYGISTRISVEPATGTPSSLVVVAPRGLKCEIKRAAYATLLMPDVGTPGESWLLGKYDTLVGSGWLRLLGTAGLVCLLLAAALANAQDVLRHGSLRVAARHAALAVGIGVVIAVWQGNLLVSVLPRAAFPWRVALTTTAGASATLVLLTCLVTLAARFRVKGTPGGVPGELDPVLAR
jgi:hypothetical protein